MIVTDKCGVFAVIVQVSIRLAKADREARLVPRVSKLGKLVHHLPTVQFSVNLHFVQGKRGHYGSDKISVGQNEWSSNGPRQILPKDHQLFRVFGDPELIELHGEAGSFQELHPFAGFLHDQGKVSKRPDNAEEDLTWMFDFQDPR